MDLKHEFLSALQSGGNHESLLELVRRSFGRGLTQEQAYNMLQEIWLEYGYDESTVDSPLRENLEFVMETIWFQGRNAG